MPLGKVQSAVGWIFKRARAIPLEKVVVGAVSWQHQRLSKGPRVVELVGYGHRKSF